MSRIGFDLSEIEAMIAADEIAAEVILDAEQVITDIFTDLTAPPPIGTPVDEGTARNGWQLDLSVPGAPETYNTVPYINRLNDGHSKQSPAGFIDAAVDRHTD